MKKHLKAFALLLSLSVALSLLFACSKKPAERDDAVIASIGDQKITLGLFKSAFISYADYYSQMGADPFTSKSDLEYFQDMVLEAVVNDAIILHHAQEDGFALSEAEKSEAENSAAMELEEIRTRLMTQAEELHASDASKTVEQHFDGLIREMSKYYTGTAMSFDEYCEEYKCQLLDTALINAYRQAFADDLTVSETEIADWYEKQLDSDRKLYEEKPGQYFTDAVEYENYGDQYTDVYPPTYTPDGYQRVFDIVVYPNGELGEEYQTLRDEMDDIASRCSELLFSDALSGHNDNSETVAELIANYKALEAQANEMYEAYVATARAKIDEAYAQLLNGVSFKEIMKRYSEAKPVGADEDVVPQNVLEKGKLISITIDCGDSDWSNTFKEVFAMTPKGEFSSVFTDEDGSLHILMHGEDEPSGSVDSASIKEAIVRIVRNEKTSSEWQNKLSEWRDDPALHIDMDTVRSVGLDRLPADG